MKSMLRTLSATVTLLIAAASAHAGLVGTTISQCANSVYAGSVTADPTACNLSTSQPGPGSAVVGAGVEFSLSGNRFLDFSDNTLTITYVQPVGSASPDLFVFDLDMNITSLSLASLNPLGVTFTYLDDHLGVLISSPLENGVVVLNIGTDGTVPEPGSLALVAFALLAVGTSRYRRRS